MRRQAGFFVVGLALAACGLVEGGPPGPFPREGVPYLLTTENSAPTDAEAERLFSMRRDGSCPRAPAAVADARGSYYRESFVPLLEEDAGERLPSVQVEVDGCDAAVVGLGGEGLAWTLRRVTANGAVLWERGRFSTPPAISDYEAFGPYGGELHVTEWGGATLLGGSLRDDSLVGPDGEQIPRPASRVEDPGAYDQVIEENRLDLRPYVSRASGVVWVRDTELRARVTFALAYWTTEEGGFLLPERYQTGVARVGELERQGNVEFSRMGPLPEGDFVSGAPFLREFSGGEKFRALYWLSDDCGTTTVARVVEGEYEFAVPGCAMLIGLHSAVRGGREVGVLLLADFEPGEPAIGARLRLVSFELADGTILSDEVDEEGERFPGWIEDDSVVDFALPFDSETLSDGSIVWITRSMDVTEAIYERFAPEIRFPEFGALGG